MIGPLLVCCFLLRCQLYMGTSWFGEFAPNYLAPAVVFFALRSPKNHCYCICFFLGLFLDCFSLAPFGTQATLYLFFSHLCVCSKKWIYHNVGHIQVIWAGVFSVGIYLGNLLLLQYHNFTTPAIFSIALIGRTILTLFFSFPILLLFQASCQWFHGKTRQETGARISSNSWQWR